MRVESAEQQQEAHDACRTHGEEPERDCAHGPPPRSSPLARNHEGRDEGTRR